MSNNGTENLSQKSIEEIEETLHRQEKLLSNKKLISTLKDKGLKIKETISKLKDELEHRRQVDDITFALSKLSSNDQTADLDSDDDVPAQQLVKVEEDEDERVDLHQEVFCKHRSEKLQDGTAVAMNPFRLNTTKNGRPVATKSNWTKPPSDLDPELSALSPVFSETPAQLLSLTESMSIQKIQNSKLKEVEKTRRVERIYERFGTTVENCPPEVVETFLYANNKDDSSDGEEHDLSDEDDVNDHTSDTETLVEDIENMINEVL